MEQPVENRFPPNPFANPEGFAKFVETARNTIAGKKNDATPAIQQTDTKPTTQEPPSSTARTAPAAPIPTTRKYAPNPFVDPQGFFEYAESIRLASGAIRIMEENVKDIGVSEILSYLGAKTGKADRNKWKYGGWNINVDGQKWFNFNDAGTKERPGKGIGPISLVGHLMSLDKEGAIKWLADEFGGRPDLEQIKAAAGKTTTKKKYVFVAPENCPENLGSVRDYLRDQRKIPPSLIERLISEGKVYADEKHNCVFFAHGDPGLAEVRGTRTNFKGLVPGSSRTVGFTVTPKRNAENKIDTTGIAIVEAAIDAQSLHVLRPDLFVISAAGANFEFPLKVVEEAVAMGYKVFAAFDDDEAGEAAADFLMEKYPNDVSRLSPSGFCKEKFPSDPANLTSDKPYKDWNALLQKHPEAGAEYERVYGGRSSGVSSNKKISKPF